MSRNLSDWASIAEILGAVAIVISLIFVGLQISEGNRETEAASTQAALDSEMLLQATVLGHVDTWEKVATGVPLTNGVETRTGIILFNMVMTLNENRYLQMRSGYLEYRPQTLMGVVVWPFYDIWRESEGAQSRSPEWLEFLDSERARVTAE
jgi:hypothetical protein